MLLSRGYKCRVYPTPDQRQVSASWFGCCRFVWNQLLEDSAAVFAFKLKSQDFLHQLSRRLCRDNRAVTVEGLRFQRLGLGLGRGGRKSASDAGFGRLRAMLHYKASEEGCRFQQLDRFRRTTGICPVTLKPRLPKLQPHERHWTCSCCGTTWDRDTAAAQVIWKLGEDVAHRKRVDAPKRTLQLTAVATSVATKRAAAATEAAV